MSQKQNRSLANSTTLSAPRCPMFCEALCKRQHDILLAIPISCEDRFHDVVVRFFQFSFYSAAARVLGLQGVFPLCLEWMGNPLSN